MCTSLRPSAKFSTLLVMATAFLTNFSKFFEFRTVYNGDDQVEIITTKLNEDHRYVVFMSYYTLLVTGFVPLTALCWFNCCIYLQIRRYQDLIKVWPFFFLVALQIF